MFVVQNVIFNFPSLPKHMFYQIYGTDYYSLVNEKMN